MQHLTMALVKDGETIYPAAAVGIARSTVMKRAATDLHWVNERGKWLADGGKDAPERVATKQAWATKWAGLVQLRRDDPSGFAAAEGW